jgi:hypothetical protein
VIGHTWIADRPEVDRVELQQLIDAVDIHHSPGLQVVVAAPRDLSEFAGEPTLFGGEVEDLDTGGNDFLPDAVAGDHCDTVCFHFLSTKTPKNATPDATIPLSAGSTHG